MIELRHLRYFIAVAEELHFGHAAKKLHVAQPALSQRIQALEEQLGVQLLWRSRRRVQLTVAGDKLLEEGRRVLQMLDRAEALTCSAGHGEIGYLTIGVVRSATVKILPKLLREYRHLFPAVTLTVLDLPCALQVEKIRRGEIDVGLVRTPVNTEGLVARTIDQDRIVILMPDSHPLAERKEIPLKAVAAEPLILFPVSPRPNWADIIIAICRQAGFEPKVAQHAAEVATAVSFVSAGLGLTLVPESLTRFVPDGVVWRPVLDPGCTTRLLVVHRKEGVSEIAKEFLSVINTLWPDPNSNQPNHDLRLTEIGLAVPGA